MKSFKSLLLVLFISAFVAVACDNPSGQDDDHADVVGYALYQNNAEILRFENNQFNFNKDGAWNAYFSVVDGETRFTLSPAVIPDMERGLTPSITIRWLDAAGEYVDLPQEADGGEYRLEWTWGQILGERPANLEQHGSDGSWGFHFRPDYVGEEVLVIRLDHGDHADFVAGPLKVFIADADEVNEDGTYPHTRDRNRER